MLRIKILNTKKSKKIIKLINKNKVNYIFARKNTKFYYKISSIFIIFYDL